MSEADRKCTRAIGSIGSIALAAILLAGCGESGSASTTGGADAGQDAVPVCDLSTTFKWQSTGPILSAVSDASHALLSIKDPSVVFYNNEWHVYASSVNANGDYNMVYLHFSAWSKAAAAKPYYMDMTAGLAGYHAAPEIFYYVAQKKWYLIYQSQPPSYSTTDDLSKPETWTKPASFFPTMPASVVGQWIDFWVMSDGTNFYLFFSGDDGRFYRSQTTNAAFPKGFSDPVIVMQDPDMYALFEAGHVYRIRGQNKYLAIIEAIGQNRYFRSFTADRLDGDWTPLAATWENPFAGSSNVTFPSGAWTHDISHGELLRDNYDETPTIQPCDKIRFLYQGVDPSKSGVDYNLIPWQLGLLTQSN